MSLWDEPESTLWDETILLVHTVPATTGLLEVETLIEGWKADYLARRRALQGQEETLAGRQHRFWYVAVTQADGQETLMSGISLGNLLDLAYKRLGPGMGQMTLGELPGFDRIAPTIDVHASLAEAEALADEAPYGVVRVRDGGKPLGVFSPKLDRMYSSGLPGRMYSPVQGLNPIPEREPTRSCPTCKQPFGALEMARIGGTLQWVCPHCQAPYPDYLP